MKISIQAYWGATINSLQNSSDVSAEDRIKQDKSITICDIIINGKFEGQVIWDGNKLTIEPFSRPN